MMMGLDIFVFPFVLSPARLQMTELYFNECWLARAGLYLVAGL